MEINMKEIIFYREVKTLINGIRSYGIQHCHITNMKLLMKNSKEREEFVIQVHKGFYLAQKNAIYLLQRILKEKKQLKIDVKQARRNQDKEKEKILNASISKVKYQEMVVRKSMDAIAWQLFGYDLTVMRRMYCGEELIDITDSNLDSELRYIEEYVKENPDGFALINDLTSFVQIGDIVTYAPLKGIEIIELKEGKVNLEMFQIINNVIETKCPRYLRNELQKMDKKRQEHFYRDIKQIDKGNQVLQTINEGEGVDLFTGLNVKIDEDEIQLETFENIINNLLDECDKKGYAISVIEQCLLIGVYNVDKFPSTAFDIWAKEVGIAMPVIDFRYAMFDPLGYPVFLFPFKDSYIMEIIQGKKVIKMTIDIKMWMNMLDDDGIKWRWLSKKETARINSKFKGKHGIFSLEGKGIEIENEKGIKQYIGEGVLSRIFTRFNTPSAIKKLLISSMEKIEVD